MKMKSVVFTVLVLLALTLTPACAHRQPATTPSGTGTTAQVQVTPWEQVMVTNGIIASSNHAVLDGVINANKTKKPDGTPLIDDATTKQIVTLQALIASDHKQLTTLLSQGQDAAKGNITQINGLINDIRTATDQMIQTGNLNIKNPTTQLTIQASVDTIATMCQLLLTNLQLAGVGAK